MDRVDASIDWGDGGEETGTALDALARGVIQGRHVYAEPGDYEIKLHVLEIDIQDNVDKYDSVGPAYNPPAGMQTFKIPIRVLPADAGTAAEQDTVNAAAIASVQSQSIAAPRSATVSIEPQYNRANLFWNLLREPIAVYQVDPVAPDMVLQVSGRIDWEDGSSSSVDQGVFDQGAFYAPHRFAGPGPYEVTMRVSVASGPKRVSDTGELLPTIIAYDGEAVRSFIIGAPEPETPLIENQSTPGAPPPPVSAQTSSTQSDLALVFAIAVAEEEEEDLAISPSMNFWPAANFGASAGFETIVGRPIADLVIAENEFVKADDFVEAITIDELLVDEANLLPGPKLL